MKKIFASFIAILAGLFAVSCNSILDMTPTDKVSDKTIWAETQSAEYAVNYLYSYVADIYDGQCLLGLTESLTDEFKYGSYTYNALCYLPSEVAYGGQTLSATYVDAYLGRWGTMYWYLRTVNEGLHALHTYGALSDNDSARLEGEMRLVRAWIYFELLKRYKSIIIYDEDLSAMSKDKALSSEEAGWDFVEADLKFAEENLPVKADAKGRLDKGMAYAFASRAMLYAKRYDAVIAAANKVKELGYSLMPAYADSYGKAINAGNTEAILQYTYDKAQGVSHSFDFYYSPGGDFSSIGATGGGYGVPTQEMVESYELASGGFPDWSPWHSGSAVTTNPPYALLEPRFAATILYNGAAWKNRTIESYVDGTDGFAVWNLDREPKGRTVTGYYLRKGVDESHDVASLESVSPTTILRYGEVLLNKAEACYRNGDAAGANAALKEIRARVGLGHSDKAGDALFAAIRQERRVELAYEGLWYWDLRRWGLSDKSYAEGGLNGYQVHGLKITKLGSGFTYTYVSVDDQDRNYPSRMYQFPMPQSELESNALVEQYSEWK